MDELDVERLYLTLRGPILVFAARRLSLEQSKDVIGDTFEVVWRKRAEAPALSDEWPAWCFGIAKNKVLQNWQQRTRRPHDYRFIEDYDTLSSEGRGVDVADLVAESLAGRWVWAQLSEAERVLANISFLRDLRVVEAAGMLGISRTAYTSRLNRLRRRIAALCESADTDRSLLERVG